MRLQIQSSDAATIGSPRIIIKKRLHVGYELQPNCSGQQRAIADRQMIPEFLEKGPEEPGVLIRTSK